MFRCFIVSLIFVATSTQSVFAQQSEASNEFDQSGVSEQSTRAFSKRPKNFTVGLAFGGGGQVSFDHVMSASENRTGSGKMSRDISAPMGFVLEYRQMTAMSWGFQVGVEIENWRSIGGGTLKEGGETFILKSSALYRSKLRSEVMYANLVYRRENFYIPVGLNYLVPHYEVESETMQGIEADAYGRVGGQIGIGVQLNELIGFELLSRASGIELREKYGQYVRNTGVGYISDTRILGKFSF